MEIPYRALAKHSKWRSETNASKASLPAELAELICAKGSLTESLMSLSSGAFSVDVLRQRFCVPYWHEQKKMQQRFSRVAMVREVELRLYNEAVVYARSVIPLSLTTRGGKGLANLGRTPLGHLLFKDGKIRVSKREFLQESINNISVTARRTPYDYQGSQILVSEFFLPTIYKYL